MVAARVLGVAAHEQKETSDTIESESGPNDGETCLSSLLTENLGRPRARTPMPH